MEDTETRRRLHAGQASNDEVTWLSVDSWHLEHLEHLDGKLVEAYKAST